MATQLGSRSANEIGRRRRGKSYKPGAADLQRRKSISKPRRDRDGKMENSRQNTSSGLHGTRKIQRGGRGFKRRSGMSSAGLGGEGLGAGSQVPDLAGGGGKLVAGLDARSTSRATAVAGALLSWSTARATAVSGMQGLASSWRAGERWEELSGARMRIASWWKKTASGTTGCVVVSGWVGDAEGNRLGKKPVRPGKNRRRRVRLVRVGNTLFHTQGIE